MISFYGLYSLTYKFTVDNIDPKQGTVDAIIVFDRDDGKNTLITPASTLCNSMPVIDDYDQSRYTLDQIKSKYAPLYQSIPLREPTSLQAVLDYPSFVDYFILTEFCSNYDGYLYSAYTYTIGDKIYAGFLWDYNIAYGNVINTIDPFSDSSFYWSCQLGQLYDVFRYYLNNRFIQSDYATSPTNPLNYDEYMKTVKTTVLPSTNIEFCRSCTEGNVMSQWFIRLLQDPVFIAGVRKRYKKLRRIFLSYTNIKSILRSIARPLIDTGTAMKDIRSWHVTNYGANFSNVPVPNQSINDAQEFYRQNLQYKRHWIKKRLEWLDINIFLPLPANTDNLNKWPKYQCSCNRLPEDISSRICYNSTAFKK